MTIYAEGKKRFEYRYKKLAEWTPWAKSQPVQPVEHLFDEYPHIERVVCVSDDLSIEYRRADPS